MEKSTYTEKQKKYYESHKRECNERVKAYRKKNPDKNKKYIRNYWERKIISEFSLDKNQKI